MTYKTEFSSYDDELTLPAGWVDTSWHNDTCPSFEKIVGDTTIRLWCDFKDPDLREVGGNPRFTVCKHFPDEDIFECLGQSESMAGALAIIDCNN
jgi:hypothetical protein